MAELVFFTGTMDCGKSTLAAELAALIGTGAKVVPMDGFHYDDAVLIARGARARKGAPSARARCSCHRVGGHGVMRIIGHQRRRALRPASAFAIFRLASVAYLAFCRG